MPNPHLFRVCRVPVAILALAAAVLAACGSGNAAEKSGSAAEKEAAQEGFIGTIVYEATAGGPDEQGAEMFRSFGPSREVVVWGRGGRMRLETTGGLMEGIIIANFADSAFFDLDTAARVARPAAVQSMNLEDIPEDMRVSIGWRFEPAEMEATGEEATYAGRRCRIYTMKKSQMLKAGATARACVAEDIRVRPSRYHFRAPASSGTMVSLPLQYGIREGLPLWVEVKEANTIVTYKAVSLTPGEPADSLFSIPPGYTTAKPDSAG